MTDPVDNPDRGVGSKEAPPGMPRWVKVSAVVVLVVALALLVIMALTGVEHGPGLHTGTGDTSGIVAPVAIASLVAGMA